MSATGPRASVAARIRLGRGGFPFAPSREESGDGAQRIYNPTRARSPSLPGESVLANRVHFPAATHRVHMTP